MALKRFALGTSSRSQEIGVAQNDTAASWLIHVSGTVGTMSITPKGYAQGKPSQSFDSSGVPREGTNSDALSSSDATGLAYYVGSTGVLTASSTPISAAGTYRIITDGASLVLDYTAGGGSSPVIHARPLRG